MLRLRPAAVLAALAVSLSLPALAQVEGKFGQALQPNTNYAAAAPNPVYTVLPLTVECWAKLSTKSAYNILAANEPKHSVTHWELYAEKTTGHLAAYLPGFAPNLVRADTDVVDGKWHYLALTCDGQTAKLYLDAKEVASTKLTKKFSYPDVGPLTFGHIEGVDTTKDLAIDELRISRIVRPIEKTPTEPFAPDKDTVGLWHFDGDGQGGYADVSTTKNPATLKPRNKPTNAAANSKANWPDMDTGPFFTSTLQSSALKNNVVYKGISVRLAKGKASAVTDAAAAICFDTDTCRVFAGWTDGFLKLPASREGLSGPPDIAGKVAFSTLPGPGWAQAGEFADPRPDKLGPLPPDWAKYRGLYLHGDRVIFSYTVGNTEILESWDTSKWNGATVFNQTLEIAPTRVLEMRLLTIPKGAVTHNKGEWPVQPKPVQRALAHWVEDGVAGTSSAVALTGDIAELTTASDGGGWTSLLIKASDRPRRIKLSRWIGLTKDVEPFTNAMAESAAPIELRPLTKGGPTRWGDALDTKGILGDSSAPYAVDTLTAPEDNPFKSFLRFAGHDFFKDGSLAVCSVSGDVWIVTGINEKLDKLTWRRFATGLHQPLGLRIVNDGIYVLGRDQITKLHDLNNDGEADFYENFCSAWPVTTNGHAYATNLETDPEGNFYFTKCGDNTNIGGTVVRVSKDGKYAEPFAPGLRNPNGLGISPTGLITEADNQGEWVPASRIDVVEPGKFLGYKPMAHGAPAPDMGRPLCFLPQNLDNSSGGQTWVTSDKWGPFNGHLLHTSYGSAALIHVMTEKLEGEYQGAAVRFPLKFESGVMRARFNPADGQLYLSGLRGWQTSGVRPGALHRVRYTGATVTMPVDLRTHNNGVSLTFATELDPATANDPGNYAVLRWTYSWTGEYPSRHFSVIDPKKQGYDTVEVKSAKLLADRKTVFLEIPDITPVKQQQITLNLKTAAGAPVQYDIYQTIHHLGPAYIPR
jgi:hypothetical protein